MNRSNYPFTLLKPGTLAVALLACVNTTVMSESLQEQYDAALHEYESAVSDWSKRFDPSNDTTDMTLRFRDWPGWTYSRRFLDIGAVGGSDAAAFDALAQVVRMGRSVSACDRELLPVYEDALALLVQNHLANKNLRRLLSRIARTMTSGSERLLRTILVNSTDRELRGCACLCLALLLSDKREQMLSESWLLHAPGSPQEYIATRSAAGLRSFLSECEPDSLFAEASQYLNRTIQEFGVAGGWGQTWLFVLSLAARPTLVHVAAVARGTPA